MTILNSSLSRRNMIKAGSLFLSTPLLSSCSMKGGLWRKHNTYSKIKKNVHWARRNEWNGEEAVFGLIQIGDRYLMIRRNDGLGWTFPGGLVIPGEHGQKNEEGSDLIRAASTYAHDQALIAVLGDEGMIISYGYAIDTVDNRMLLVHWLKLAIPNDFLPTPSPNLKDSLEAKWIALDDPEVGPCLKQRLNEIVEVKEGGTITLEKCQT